MRGSHGTCKTFAQSIVQDGFQLGKRGRLGKGVYFWIFSDSENGEKLGRELSEAWFKFALRKQFYRTARDKGCTVVFVDLDVEDSFALDFDDVEVDADFSEFYNYAVKRFPDLGDEEKSCICDEFVALMEEERKAKYDVILGTVDVPSNGLPNDHFLKFKRRGRCAAVQNCGIVQIRRTEDI